MSGSYGFSINLELKPNLDVDNLHDHVKEFINENGGHNESEILQSLFIDEEQDMIVFFGDNEDTWRYDYTKEVISLLRKIEEYYDGYFKGEFLWYTYEMHGDIIQDHQFDGKGGVEYKLTTEPLEDDEWGDEDE